MVWALGKVPGTPSADTQMITNILGGPLCHLCFLTLQPHDLLSHLCFSVHDLLSSKAGTILQIQLDYSEVRNRYSSSQNMSHQEK